MKGNIDVEGTMRNGSSMTGVMQEMIPPFWALLELAGRSAVSQEKRRELEEGEFTPKYHLKKEVGNDEWTSYTSQNVDHTERVMATVMGKGSESNESGGSRRL